jgi:hypothetical protein
MKTEVLLIAGGAVILALAYAKISTPGGAAEIGQGAASAAVDMANGALTGAVVSTGAIFGIPETNPSIGQAQLEAGDYWEASFNLPAKDFIFGVWKKLTN